MAKPALKDMSKTDLAEQYHRLLMRTKKANQVAKQEGEALVRDMITLGSGALVQFWLAKSTRDAGQDPFSMGDATAEAQQFSGVDKDLAIGAVAAVAGLAKMGGKMSETVRAAGIGILTSYAGRLAYRKGGEAEA